MIKKIKDITLFIDDEAITDAKIFVPYSSSDKGVIYYTVEGFFDDSGEKKEFLFPSHGSITLKCLEEEVNKVVESKRLK